MYMITDFEEDRECDAAKCIIAQSMEQHPVWVGCDCGVWLHCFCAGLEEPTDGFLCDACSY